jgi:cytochrome c556
MITRLGHLVLVLLVATGVASAQTARTAGVMREKLGHAQKILEAVTTSNQAILVRESEALSRIAASPAWNELRTPELRGYTDRFLKTVADLDAAAKNRDFDAAAAAFSTMTTTCYQCHKHLKDSRIAARP